MNIIIIFSIQRFNRLNNNIKNKSPVIFQKILDFNNFIENKSSDINNIYKMVNIINHIESLEYRHYYCNILIDNDWFEFKDNMVNSII